MHAGQFPRGRIMGNAKLHPLTWLLAYGCLAKAMSALLIVVQYMQTMSTVAELSGYQDYTTAGLVLVVLDQLAYLTGLVAAVAGFEFLTRIWKELRRGNETSRKSGPIASLNAEQV